MRQSRLRRVSANLMFLVKLVALWPNSSPHLYFKFILDSTAGEGLVYCTFKSAVVCYRDFWLVSKEPVTPNC